MIVLLERYGLGSASTLGRLYVDGVISGFTLEDERRIVKVYGETCIPEGDYHIELRTEGGMHAEYSKRFPDFHKGMLWIRDPVGFTDTYLHIGNKTTETLGCPLLGARPMILPDSGEFEVQQSEIAYRHTYQQIVVPLLRKEPVPFHVTVRVAA